MNEQLIEAAGAGQLARVDEFLTSGANPAAGGNWTSDRAPGSRSRQQRRHSIGRLQRSVVRKAAEDQFQRMFNRMVSAGACARTNALRGQSALYGSKRIK